MAKKNIASLMNGLMGNEIENTIQNIETTEDISPVTVEMKENLEKRRRQNVGRPEKGKERNQKNEIRATFIVDPGLIRKIKYISLVEGNLLKDVVNEALTAYISSWEESNGKINLPNSK